jgi:hypothetical protein
MPDRNKAAMAIAGKYIGAADLAVRWVMRDLTGCRLNGFNSIWWFFAALCWRDFLEFNI